METLNYQLDHYDHIPESLAQLTSADEIKLSFPNPSLISIDAKSTETVFLSVLQHGNELTSFFVLQKLQKHLKSHPLSKKLIIFVGNVDAAEKQVRFLSTQNDFNRSWGSHPSAEQRLTSNVKQHLPDKLFATVDIHNNTGKNPMYACISQKHRSHIYLGSLFSRTLVYFTNPKEALSRTFSELGPSVTLECGHSDNKEGIDKAFQFVLDVLALETLENHTPEKDIHIYQTIGKITVAKDIEYSFTDTSAPLSFPEGFENLNFSPLPKGFVFAQMKDSTQPGLLVIGETGEDITRQFMKLIGHSLCLTDDLTPAMLTTKKDIIQKDCLGYFMKQMIQGEDLPL